MGGTFNPVHHGHLITARWACEALGLDKVALMPNARSPLRQDEVLAPADLRLSWVQAAVKGEPLLDVLDTEVKRQGISYLVETLEVLNECWPEREWVFLMGADSLETFDCWVRVEDILQLVQVQVLPRPGLDSREALAALTARAPEVGNRVQLLPQGPRVDISATEIRGRIRNGRSIRYLVPESIQQSIAGHPGFQD
jgi:nicotinate-nucleotide adenylyltransferase